MVLTLCPRSLDGIPECVLPHFHEAAEQLIKEKGATNVVAAALAYISGAKEIVSRSLLSAHQVHVGIINFFCLNKIQYIRVIQIIQTVKFDVHSNRISVWFYMSH